MTRTYTAELSGSSFAAPVTATFSSIREARQWAKGYGQTADHCTIRDRRGRVVASHRRSQDGDGRRWYRATV